ncbi:MAG: YitT family protein [Bacilli bacterium]|nr:YitT family protein [Bacilli bacterium]
MNVFSKNKYLKLADYINKKSYGKRVLEFIIGCLIVSLAYNIFIASNNLVPGGVGGIAVILNSLFGINNSTVIVVANIFLLIASLILLDKEKTRASLLGTMLFPIFVTLTEDINVWLQIDTSHLLLSALFGGILYGLGAGIVFRAGFSMGGTDIINQILSKYLKQSIGKSMLMSDGLIVLSSGLFFGMNSMLYSIIILYCISLMADRVILGISDSKAFFVITDKEDDVRDYIINTLGHGVTVFKGKGGYKRQNENLLMAVIPTSEYYKLTEGIKMIDKDAFYIITDTYQVFGGE